MSGGAEPSALADWEKAYFDTLRNKRIAVTLLRMRFEGEEVAVACQELTGTTIGKATGLMPLAILCTDEMIQRLDYFGQNASAHDPADFVEKRRPDGTQ